MNADTQEDFEDPSTKKNIDLYIGVPDSTSPKTMKFASRYTRPSEEKRKLNWKTSDPEWLANQHKTFPS